MLIDAREAFRKRDWLSARERFRAARAAGASLSADDTYAFSDAAWWLGLVEESLTLSEEAYALFMAEGRAREAAFAGFGIAYTLSLRHEEALASAWAARAMRVVDGLPEGPEHGFMRHMEFESALANADFEAALEHARVVGELGKRFADPNLAALGVVGEGRALVKMGRIREGMALLDEAMLAALSPELDPSWAGNIYCHLMLACHELSDLRRAAEWTRATARWCESMPGAGPFMGICRVHRAQVLQVQGQWEQAEREVTRVCRELANFHVSIVAEAYYELGEIRRRRGDLAGAEQAYREAHGRGRDPQPGLALLRLAQGDVAAAAAALDALLAQEQGDRLLRARYLAPRVEVALAAEDLATAGAACDEIDATTEAFGSSGLRAVAAHVRGATILAHGDAAAALPLLRRAFHCWNDLGAPYEAARVRLLIARAWEMLGDREAATLERAAAEAAFRSLGIGTPAADRMLPGGLTPRELEVLGLATEGKSNAEIAAELVLSVRTVERHLATVYGKLGFGGRNARAAAVSFALREGLRGAGATRDT